MMERQDIKRRPYLQACCMLLKEQLARSTLGDTAKKKRIGRGNLSRQ